jgi:prepilin-type N-terminal cleavage/methylation domain-containing protein
MHLRPARERRSDEGFTLVELSISMLLFGVLGAVLLTTLIASKNAVATSRENHDLNEEARVALNRMSRELRQADAIVSVNGSTGATGLTFSVDFNGNGVIDASAADPEVITYEWDGSKILLTANDTSGTPVTQPILAGKVSSFSLDYFSSDYRRDCASPKDGRTSWRELDDFTTTCAARGSSGHVNDSLDASEIADIDTITIAFTVLEGARRQDYRTQVDLRNAQ